MHSGDNGLLSGGETRTRPRSLRLFKTATGLMARPLQLVRCDDAGNFHVGEEAQDCLRAVRGPIAVVAVCGRARQGKSFILNQIAANGAGEGSSTTTDCGGASHSGFEVAPTHRPCTKVSCSD